MFSAQSGKTNTLKKGNTIAEICIVIAVLAIVAVMTVSFTLTVSAQGKIVNENNAVSDDIGFAQESFGNFIGFYDDSENEFRVNLNEINVYKGGVSIAYYKLNESEILYVLPNGTAVSKSVKAVKVMTFSVISGTDSINTRHAIKCNVSYGRPSSETNKNTDFIKKVFSAQVTEE